MPAKGKIYHIQNQHGADFGFMANHILQAKQTDPRNGSCYGTPLKTDIETEQPKLNRLEDLSPKWCRPRHETYARVMQSSGDDSRPVKRNHAHGNGSHEDLHRGTVALADGVIGQRGTGPLLEINMRFHVVQVDLGSACISANRRSLTHRMMFECHSPGW